ncbi:hypothetical protein GCM10010156_65960 [Planobispora rosea]|uniref:Uncharacterized protein n=2 Tax=Planobispora rosea TaxID=35762 RepID=A0A8J3S746_PLARO|nr:hypothetical protein GCM10010156_65960 [Planobispora rosea]GIH87960.1 hypothetical protein Pro02_63680 [Planobispora rosea]
MCKRTDIGLTTDGRLRRHRSDICVGGRHLPRCAGTGLPPRPLIEQIPPDRAGTRSAGLSRDAVRQLIRATRSRPLIAQVGEAFAAAEGGHRLLIVLTERYPKDAPLACGPAAALLAALAERGWNVTHTADRFASHLTVDAPSP